jgi:uncharacterized membrane protein
MAETCRQCGTALNEGANFCPSCGTPAVLPAAETAAPLAPAAPAAAAPPDAETTPAAAAPPAPEALTADTPPVPDVPAAMEAPPTEAMAVAPSTEAVPSPPSPSTELQAPVAAAAAPAVIAPPVVPSAPAAAYPPPAAAYPPAGGYVPPGAGYQQSSGRWTPPPPPYMRPIDQIVSEGYHIDLGAAISDGWNLFLANAGGFVAFALLGGVIAVLMAVTVVGLLFITPLVAGLLIVPLAMLKGRGTRFGNFFDGFMRLGGFLLLGLVMGIFIILGYIALIIPGIYLTVAYTWAMALMIDRGLGFWDAMSTSMRVVNKNFWETLLLVLVLSIINGLGSVVFVGYLLTLPLTFCILAVTYRQIFGLNPNR